jgi:hypothetical protein
VGRQRCLQLRGDMAFEARQHAPLVGDVRVAGRQRQFAEHRGRRDFVAMPFEQFCQRVGHGLLKPRFMGISSVPVGRG